TDESVGYFLSPCRAEGDHRWTVACSMGVVQTSDAFKISRPRCQQEIDLTSVAASRQSAAKILLAKRESAALSRDAATRMDGCNPLFANVPSGRSAGCSSLFPVAWGRAKLPR